MERITLDAAAIEQLRKAGGIREICDESGKVVGVFRPHFDPAEYDLEPKVSNEELRRRAESNGPWYTTEQVLEHLRKLEEEGR